MIKKKCKGFNLLNHCKQTNKMKNINIEYTYDISNYRNEWGCVFTFEHNEQKYSYKRNSYRKRKVLLELINEIDPIIRKLN